MNKYTKKVNDQNVISLEDVKIEGEYITGEVIDRLAKFEGSITFSVGE